MSAIRDFGTNAALGVGLVFCFNMLLVPSLLRVLPEPLLLAPRATGALLERWCAALVQWVVQRSRAVVAVFGLGTLVCIALVPRLVIDQRSNEEVPRGHELRRGQELLEHQFSGYLGPELLIERYDQQSMRTPEALAPVERVAQQVKRLREVQTCSPYSTRRERGSPC
jgi:uncharacterized membrane protein YdfJ with MMPL/SSD domain